MNELLSAFKRYLHGEEKSRATIEKYTRDVRRFLTFLAGRNIDKAVAIAYKEHLMRSYTPACVNSMLIALNDFLRFIDKPECCVRTLKIQKQIFSNPEKELSRKEYQRLVQAAEGTRLSYILQTICGTGIRVSELPYITAEAVQAGKAIVNCKNKMRVIFIPTPLRRLLKEYIKKSNS